MALTEFFSQLHELRRIPNLLHRRVTQIANLELEVARAKHDVLICPHAKDPGPGFGTKVRFFHGRSLIDAGKLLR